MNKQSQPPSYDFRRYLASKVQLDDRCLNVHVRQALEQNLKDLKTDGQLQVLELGAGIGTMIDRLIGWGLLEGAEYLALDLIPANLEQATERLQRRTVNQQQVGPPGETGLTIQVPNGSLKLTFEVADATEYIHRQGLQGSWHWIIAHAFMDLVDLDAMLPGMARMLAENGLLYLTHNFDGVTRFTPEIEPALDAHIESLYHQSMDERTVDGQPSGDSQTGSRLLSILPEYGIDVIAAGASDWVVHPYRHTYLGDEAYFLHHIIETMDQQLRDHPQLDQNQFRAWVKRRHLQVEAGELSYIAHQIDILGKLAMDRR